METGVAEADAQVRPLLRRASTYHWTSSVTHTPEWAVTGSWPTELRRCAALAMHLEVVASSMPSVLNDVVRSLADGEHDWTRRDLLWCLEAVGQGLDYDLGVRLELPATIAAHLAPADLADLAPAISGLFDELAASNVPTAGPRRRVVDAAIPQALTAPRVAVCRPGCCTTGMSSVRSSAPTWGTSSPRRACPSLLVHCASLDRPAASATWLRGLDQQLTTATDGRKAVRTILEAFAAHRHPVHDDSDRLLRGLVWALSRDWTRQRRTC